MSEAKDRVLDLMSGRWRSQILYAGVELGVFEIIGTRDMDAAEMARELEVDTELLYRLLRALGSLGLLAEGGGRTFSLTAAGALLRKDHPETLRGVVLLEEGPEHYALWRHLPAMVRDGTQNAFVREFGRKAFDHAACNPGYAAVFDQAMSSYSRTETAWVLEALKGYDFSKLSRVCDVGGGAGHLLCHLLVEYPHLKGTVLERPGVIEDREQLWATRMNLQDRCGYVAGDMFSEVPPADAYLMKHIIHDWNDSECVQILSTMGRAAPEGGRAFIAECVVPGPESPHFAKLFDIHMMCWGTGKERTEAEYAALFAEAGWRYVQTWYPPSRALGVVEAVKG